MKGAPFSLGKFGMLINVITLCWIVLSAVIFCMPTAIAELTPESMNYASVGELFSFFDALVHTIVVRFLTRSSFFLTVFMFFFVVSALYYFALGKKQFHGPQAQIGEKGVPQNNLQIDSLRSDENEKARLD